MDRTRSELCALLSARQYAPGIVLDELEVGVSAPDASCVGGQVKARESRPANQHTAHRTKEGWSRERMMTQMLHPLYFEQSIKDIAATCH